MSDTSLQARLLTRSSRSGLLALLALFLITAGCAADHLHRDGLSLIQEGRYEDGLSKLSDAAQQAPKRLDYRADYMRTREQVVNRLVVSAANAQSAERFDEAAGIYQRILKLAPGNTRATQGLADIDAENRHAKALATAQDEFKKGNMLAAKAWVNTIFLEDPGYPRALALQRQIDEQVRKETMAYPSLLPRFKKPVTLQFRDANLKMVLEALYKASGINVLLEKDVRNDLKVSIFVKDVSVEDAIDLICLQNQLEKKILGENTIFIYPATPAKIRDYQDLVIRRFHLTNADVKQVQTMLKTILKTKDIFIDDASNSVVMRDTPDAVKLAEKLVAEQDIPEPEVMMEVEVLEISRSRADELGLKLPTSFGVGVPASNVRALLDTTKRDVTTTGLDATLNLKLQDSNSNVLASPRIRARNREQAKILIGNRVPVITNSVTPTSSGPSVVTGSVQYLDVGLKLDVTPDVHLDGDVAIKINLEVSSLVKEVTNSSSGTLAYEIGTRSASTVLRLNDGETQILAGLISDEDRHTADKVPGVGQFPLLGRLFSSHKDDNTKSEIILSITPHIVRNAQGHDAQRMEFWSGTDAILKSAPMQLRPGTISMASPANTPAGVMGRSLPQLAVPGRAAAPVVNAAGVVVMNGPTGVKVGDSFTLVVNARSGQAVNRLGMQVGFDPAALKVVDVLEGDYFKQHNLASTLSKQVDQEGGQVSIDLAAGGTDETAGNGSIASVVFQVLSAEKQRVDIVADQISASGGDGGTVPFNPPGSYSVTLTP